MPTSTPTGNSRPREADNGFDFLRLALAASVLYSHTFTLGGYGPEPFLVWTRMQSTVGELAVLSFFGLSGYVIAASFTRSHTVLDFLSKRIRRIIPGLWVCLLVSAFGFAALAYALRRGTVVGFPWFGEGSAASYVIANLAVKINQWGITGALDGAPYAGSINGSLWSLWPECLCYVMVAILGLTGALDANRPLLLLATGTLCVFHLVKIMLPLAGTPTLPTWIVFVDDVRFYLAYLVGACLWVWRQHFRPNWFAAGLLILTLIVVARLGGLRLVSPVFVPLALVLVGQCFAVKLRHDISYGLYIYGSPVQQLLAATSLSLLPWPVFFVVSLLLTAGCALLSWHLVERRFLPRRAP